MSTPLMNRADFSDLPFEEITLDAQPDGALLGLYWSHHRACYVRVKPGHRPGYFVVCACGECMTYRTAEVRGIINRKTWERATA